MIKINVKFLAKSLLCILLVGSMMACSKKTKEAIVEPAEISKAVQAAPVAAKPFPQNGAYKRNNGTLPSVLTLDNRNDAKVKKYYDVWKSKYVKKVTGANEYIVDMKDEAFPRTTSEAIGYGMVISAYMAGYDANAKAQFDGMFAVARKFPSRFSKSLMGWNVRGDKSGTNEVKNLRFLTTTVTDDAPDQSATDGDMDIAYALLLADKQWGSTGTINYKAEALKTIQETYRLVVNQKDWNLKIGDWAPQFDTHTRPSDFMTAHLKAFKAVDTANAAGWQKVIDTIYGIVAYQFTSGGSAKTGLMPDFMVKEGNNWAPVKGKYLESINDGYYSYNACRVPWRLMTDVITNGIGSNPIAKPLVRSMQTLHQWSTDTIGIIKFKAGYKMDGTPFKQEGETAFYEDASFTNPLTTVVFLTKYDIKPYPGTFDQAVAQHKKDYYAYFDLVANDPNNADLDYFSMTLSMQTLIFMNGNWWTPQN